MKFEITTDASSMTIEATNANHAANRYDRSVKTLKELVAKTEKLGGWITVKEDGVVIARIAA